MNQTFLPSQSMFSPVQLHVRSDIWRIVCVRGVISTCAVRHSQIHLHKLILLHNSLCLCIGKAKFFISGPQQSLKIYRRGWLHHTCFLEKCCPFIFCHFYGGMVSFYFAVWGIHNLILLSGIYPIIREFGVPSVVLEATNMFISSLANTMCAATFV